MQKVKGFNVPFSGKFRVINSYLKESKAGLMLNFNKISKDDFENISDVKLFEVPWYDKGYIIENINTSTNLSILSNESGLFCSADPNELYPVTLLDIQPGHKVLDVFSYDSGVKTIQAGLMLHNKGLLVINSEDKSNLITTSGKLQSFGITNFISVNSKDEDFLVDNKNTFDRIILTPTKNQKDEESNYSKMPYTMRKQKLTENTKKIYKVLDNCLMILKENGKLLYSSKGNSFIEEKFALRAILKKYPNIRVSTNEDDSSTGMLVSDKYSKKKMYILILEKTSHITDKDLVNDFCINNKSSITEYLDFEKKYLNTKLEDRISKVGNKFYIIPNQLIKLNNLNIESIGSAIGFLRNNKFVPLHSLACMLKKCDFKNYYELKPDSAEYSDYLNGIKFKTNLPWDLYLVGYKGYPIGWGRVRRGLFINITKKFVN